MPITTGITVTLMFHSFLSSLARSKYLSLFSLSLIFTLWSVETDTFTIRQIFFFFVADHLKVSSSGRELANCFYLPENFVHLILQDRFLFVHLPFRKVKLVTEVEGDPKSLFWLATAPRCRGGYYSFPWIAPFTLDQYLMILSIKQGGIKYLFESLLWLDLRLNSSLPYIYI